MSMWAPSTPVDVLSKLKSVDVVKTAQLAKGVFAEAFELGEKSETQIALEEWNESLKDIEIDADDVVPSTAHSGAHSAASSSATLGAVASAAHAVLSSVLEEPANLAVDVVASKHHNQAIVHVSHKESAVADGTCSASAIAKSRSLAAESDAASSEVCAALASAERELKLISKNAVDDSIQSDEQASVYDKIIHMQRERLKMLQKEKAMAEDAARQARAVASHQDRQVPAEARPSSRRGGWPSEDEVKVMGSEFVSKVVPLLKTRRGMMGLALAGLVLLLFYTMQRGVDSRGIEVESGALSRGHAVDRLIERAELEQLVVELMQDQKALAAGGESKSGKDSEVMERHMQTVSKLLMKLHNEHVRSRDKVHDKLSKENEKLVGELERLNAQVKNSLEKDEQRKSP